MIAISVNEPPDTPAPTGASKMPRIGCGLIVGTLAGLVVTLAILRWNVADSTPALTAEALRTARERWRQEGPADYDVEVRVQGPQPGMYRVQVRGSQATSAFRNDRPLAQQRTFGTWSVPGMFNTMARDVEQIERRASGNADRFTPDLTLRASFDPQYGYPRRYIRMEAGSTLDVSWEVIKFSIIQASADGGSGDEH